MTRSRSTTTEVVTIVRGRPGHLANLVTGLVRGDLLPAALRVVVMGGPDPTAAITDPPFELSVLRCEPRDGRLPLAEARNLGVDAVSTPNVVLLDVDCIPGRRLVAAYEQLLTGRDVLATGEVRYLQPHAADRAWQEADLAARSRPHPARMLPDVPAPTDRYELFWSLSFAIRTRTYAVLGGFDPAYVGYGGEDTDLGFRARERRLPLWWVPEAVAYHQHHATYDPPLQHLADIVANSRRFRTRWGVWPMAGWLRAFAGAGYVDWDPDGDRLEVLRVPTDDEVAAARCDHVEVAAPTSGAAPRSPATSPTSSSTSWSSTSPARAAPPAT